MATLIEVLGPRLADAGEATMVVEAFGAGREWSGSELARRAEALAQCLMKVGVPLVTPWRSCFRTAVSW